LIFVYLGFSAGGHLLSAVTLAAAFAAIQDIFFSDCVGVVPDIEEKPWPVSLNFSSQHPVKPNNTIIKLSKTALY